MSVSVSAALAAARNEREPPTDSGGAGGLIDMHTHAIAPALPDLSKVDPWDRWPRVERVAQDLAHICVGDRVYREIDSRCWSVESRLADMDAEGVGVQAVSPIPITLCHDAPPEGAVRLAQAQNDFFADLVSRAPGRFRALGAVPLQAPDRAVEELVRCVRELGFLGVEIGTRVGERELTDPMFEPFFDAAAQLGALVFVHPIDSTLDPRFAALGVGFGAGMPSETGLAAAGLLAGATLADRPGLRVCLAHGGGSLPALLPRLDRGQHLGVADPADERMPSSLARSLYCDSLTYDVDNLLLAAHRFGPEHVVLGTDYPFLARETPAGSLVEDPDARLATELRSAIGRTNAQRLIASVRTSNATAPVEQRSRT